MLACADDALCSGGASLVDTTDPFSGAAVVVLGCVTPVIYVITADPNSQAKSMPKRIPETNVEDEEKTVVPIIFSFCALERPILGNGAIW
jgi:hypothetical protein